VNTETRQRLELLKLARQELNNRYIKDRADAYTQWNLDSDRAWKESGIKLPFPPPPPMPTETDVIAYALALHNAQNTSAVSEPVATPPVHTVVESVPAPLKEEPRYEEPRYEEPRYEEPRYEEPRYEEPVSIPIPVPVDSTPTPVSAAPTAPAAANAVPVATDTLVETVPEVLPAPAPIIVRPVVIAGAADLATGETAIKEIFAKPSGSPSLVASETPAPSVIPLIKSMLKKGLLPTWVKADDTGIKE
jgi:hypothetical protein